MKNSKTFKKLISAILIAMFVLVPLTVISVSAASEYADDGATYFVFTDDGITAVDGDYTDYTIKGTSLSIKGAGTYVVSGSCSNGSITVKKGTTGVTLVLAGLTLTSEDTAPIACNKSSEVTIVVKSGTVNTLTDSEYNNDDNYPDNENAENAVIKCKDGSNVTLCGAGTLNIVSNGKNGIKSGATTDDEGEASLTIKDVTLNITTTVNDGINAEATLNVLSGKITVSAADDGIHSDYYLNIGEEGAAGPTITVTESYEGLEGATIKIYSGNIKVHSTEDGINAANGDITGYTFSLDIYGGNIYVDAETGDGIDSNGSLTISGGTVEVYSMSSGDNSPLDADGQVKISGGTVLAVGAPGMGASVSGNAVTFGSTSMGPMGGFGGRGQSGTSSYLVTAGSTIKILDENGNTLYSATAVRAASYVLFSSDEITSGKTYTLSVNGSSVATATAGASTSGGFPGMGGGQQGGFPGMGGGQQGGFPGAGGQPGEFGEPPEGEPGGFPGEGGQPGDFGERPDDVPGGEPGNGEPAVDPGDEPDEQTEETTYTLSDIIKILRYLLAAFIQMLRN